MSKGWMKTLVIMLITCVVSGVFLCLFFINLATSPIDYQYREVTVEIPRGTSFARTVAILEDAEIIGNARAFYLLAFLKDALNCIRAGEYDLRSSMTPMEILERLVEGKVKEYPVFIPEGYTLQQIADRLEEQGLADREIFVSLASDKKLLSSIGIEGNSAEGYLFPDTHMLNKSMGEEGIIRFMVRQFRRIMTPELLERMERLHMGENEVVTLASIIEKEGGGVAEMPLISAVFHNRLKRKMRLQSDPTVIYGIEDFDGNLRRKDLKQKTPYNTYRIRGLPPGPICSPGAEAIRAALFPAPVQYLYFVSKNNGSHHFSTNLADHNKAVLKYQIKRRK